MNRERERGMERERVCVCVVYIWHVCMSGKCGVFVVCVFVFVCVKDISWLASLTTSCIRQSFETGVAV